MGNRRVLTLSFVLVVFSGVFSSIQKDSVIFPALQVLAHVSEAPWKTKHTLDKLTSLRHTLWPEAKRIGVENYTGYSDELIAFLDTSSQGTAREQVLTYVFEAPWQTEYGHSRIRFIRDLLWSELKNKNFFNPPGLSDFLVETSQGTARNQLQQILKEILDNGELSFSISKMDIHSFLQEIQDENSEIYQTLHKITPLIYNL